MRFRVFHQLKSHSKKVPQTAASHQFKLTSDSLGMDILHGHVNLGHNRMLSSLAGNYFTDEADHSVPHQSPRLSRCKVNTKSKSYIDSMEMTKRLVEQLNARLAIVRRGGGEKAVQKHLSRNKMLPRDRIDMLIDPGTPFMELSPLAGMYSYTDGENVDGQMNVPSAGIVTGM